MLAQPAWIPGDPGVLFQPVPSACPRGRSAPIPVGSGDEGNEAQLDPPSRQSSALGGEGSQRGPLS